MNSLIAGRPRCGMTGCRHVRGAAVTPGGLALTGWCLAMALVAASILTIPAGGRR